MTECNVCLVERCVCELDHGVVIPWAPVRYAVFAGMSATPRYVYDTDLEAERRAIKLATMVGGTWTVDAVREHVDVGYRPCAVARRFSVHAAPTA